MTQLDNKQEISQFCKNVWEGYFGISIKIYLMLLLILSITSFLLLCVIASRDPRFKLECVARCLNEIIMSEYMSKNEEEKRQVYSNHKDLILWLYMSYERIYLYNSALLKKGVANYAIIESMILLKKSKKINFQ